MDAIVDRERTKMGEQVTLSRRQHSLRTSPISSHEALLHLDGRLVIGWHRRIFRLFFYGILVRSSRSSSRVANTGAGTPGSLDETINNQRVCGADERDVPRAA